MDSYSGGWTPQGHAVDARCWDRPCRSTDPSPMRPIEHSMREAMRSMESMRSVESVHRPPGECRSRSTESLRSVDQARLVELPCFAANVHHHPCRLIDHLHEHHHLLHAHDHGCRSAEHVPRLLDHRHALPPPPICHEHTVRPFNYSCRSLDHPPVRPMLMDTVIYGSHSHQPSRLPAESPYRFNCPVHSPFRFRFPNGTTEFYSHQVEPPQSLNIFYIVH